MKNLILSQEPKASGSLDECFDFGYLPIAIC
jgi:hypothetical protein